MFKFAVLTGIYSYVIFFLGVSRLLYKEYILLITILYIFLIFFVCQGLSLIRDNPWKKFNQRSKCILKFIRKNKAESSLLLIIISQAIVNFIGVLGPEHAFDALWYHLTLPKIYLINHKISFIDGGLLYYSAMPKLGEMFYTVALSINGEVLAKTLHFTFGILSALAIYKISRKFFVSYLAIIATLIFYSNLVVAWESITAYIDLIRTFFELMALWGFINWIDKKNFKWLLISAVMLGFGISSKLLAFGSLIVFLILIIYASIKNKDSKWKTFSYLSVYAIIVLAIPLPWLIFSFVNTGNPVYPIFTKLNVMGFNYSLLNPVRFITDSFNVLTKAADPISPLYIIFIPLIPFAFKKFNFELRIILIYSMLGFVVWHSIPNTGGGRYLLPYLPAFSILLIGIFKNIKSKTIKNFLLITIILSSLVSIVYRGLANRRYMPVILGNQTKNEFLKNNLNFNFGDFYDIDNYFKQNIASNDKILLFGFHNLYYVDFPFVDSSWIKKNETFNYIAVQNAEIPKKYKNWELIYINPITKVKLYSLKGKKWSAF